MCTEHAGRPFCPLRSLYAALAATMESLVTDIQYTVLIRFPVFKRCHYFNRVVGLVVLSMSVYMHTHTTSVVLYLDVLGLLLQHEI